MITKAIRLFVRGLAGSLVGILPVEVHGQAPAAIVTVDERGTVHASGISVPPSAYLDSNSQRAVLEGMRRGAPMPATPWQELSRPGPAIDAWRRAIDAFMQQQVAQLRGIYEVEIESKELGGVRTDIVTPKSGIPQRNRERVLINLHGGGYVIGARFGGQAEAIPVAALGKVKVVAIDYRLAPEHRFPAASEDVAAVYRALLKDYKAENIGIYGCSAGGRLAAQTVAWLVQQKLPSPGAIGILCGSAGATVDGDSNYTAPLLNGTKPPPPGVSILPRSPYLEGASDDDPLVSPDRHPGVLARFPPTLLITGTRDMEMSSALHTHNALVKAGVDAELHVWDGLGHGFFNLYPDIPESRDALDVIAKFFDRHLGARRPPQ